MPYVTAPKAIEAKQTYRYYVELVSLKLDYEGVPERHQIIDVVTVDPAIEAITSLLETAGYLKGYRMVGCWKPETCCPF